MSVFPVLGLTASSLWLICLAQWDATNGGFWMKNYFLPNNREYRQPPPLPRASTVIRPFKTFVRVGWGTLLSREADCHASDSNLFSI